LNNDDVTYAIGGAVFEVNRVLGTGFLEKVYENALVLELKSRGLKVQAQVPFQVKYKGTLVGDFSVDLLVEDCVIVELKAVDRILPIHEAQLLNYLKASGLRVGLLVNFGRTKATIRRFVSGDTPDVDF
jgi:GxxExxY protein